MQTSDSPCPADTLLSASVDAALGPAEAAALEAHIASCSSCRAKLAAMAAAVKALRAMPHRTPADVAFSVEVMERLRAPPPRRWPALTLASVAVTAALAIVVAANREGDFTARGGDSPEIDKKLGVELFAHAAPGAQPRPLAHQSQLGSGEGLSLVVHNRSKSSAYLMVLAVDARGAVHWLYPAYRSEAEDPASVLVAAEPQTLALPDAVALDDVAPGPLRVVALFTSAPQRVHAVEALLARTQLDGLRALDSKLSMSVTELVAR